MTPWTAALQASLSFTISWTFLKVMSIESVMPSNLLILCHLLLLLPSINNKGIMGVYFPDGPAIKNLPASVGHPGLIPGLERSPGKGSDNPFQYSGLRNPMGERSLAGYTAHGITKESDMTQRLNSNNHMCVCTQENSNTLITMEPLSHKAE